MNTLSTCNWAGIFSAAFLAIVFIQSGFDKAMNSKREMGWIRQKFVRSPLHDYVGILFGVLTSFEVISGILSGIGVIMLLVSHNSSIALAGAWSSCLTTLMLIFGQRITRDYTGAATLVPYFIVSLLSVYFLNIIIA